MRESWRRERLLMLAQRFSAAARARHLPIIASDTPIQPLVLGGAPQVLAAQEALLAAGFWSRGDPAADRSARHLAPARCALRRPHRSASGADLARSLR